MMMLLSYTNRLIGPIFSHVITKELFMEYVSFIQLSLTDNQTYIIHLRDNSTISDLHVIFQLWVCIGC